MQDFESLFTAIVRFNCVAFILLGIGLWLMPVLKQPLERIRLVQLSLLAVVITLALGAIDIVPKVDLAILPKIQSLEGKAVSSEGTGLPTESLPIQPASSLNALNQRASDMSLLAEGDVEATEPLSLADQQQVVERGDSFWSLPRLKKSIAVAFLIVSILNLLYLAVGYVLTRRLVSRAQPLTGAALARVNRIVVGLSIQSKVKLASTQLIDVPMVTGFLRPTVLLPERLTLENADQLELKHSLAHEWGHVRMHDLLTWQLASLCQVFLWSQPFYWILRRELRVAQDQLADQFALEQTQEHVNYASTLLELSRARQRLLPGALTMASRKSNLYRRIEMMMNENFKISRATPKTTLLLFLLMFLVSGGLMTSLQLTRTDSLEAKEATAHTVDDNTKETSAKDDIQKQVEHSGVVLDADTGKPIAGVTVTVTRLESYDWKEFGVTKSITDENGKYTFSIPPEQLKEPLLYILFDIAHPTYAPRHCGSYSYGMVVDNLKNGEQPWFSQFKMVRGEKVFGRLVDEQKRPVAGVQIRSDCSIESDRERERLSSTDAISDKDGRFEIVAPYEGTLKLSFIPMEHCMKYVSYGDKRGDLGDITLETGFPIHGVVKDAEGKPMSGLWVNITPEKDRNEASYEMKRSALTDKDGKFITRPVNSEKYLVDVETKATGAIEKEKLANFKELPPPAMFVQRTISVSEDTASQPFVIQAVPHVLISVRHYTPSGEISGGHSPYIVGRFDEQFFWLSAGKRTGKGAYELMVPHGIEAAELRFMTNEHSALTVQFEGSEITPQNTFKFNKLEENIDNIRVVRYPAGILKLDIVDEAGKRIDEAGIFAHYAKEEKPSDEMMMNNQIGWNKEEGVFRLSSIVPDAPVTVRFNAAGFLTQTQEFTLDNAERRTVTITLKKGEDKENTADQ